MVDDLGDSDPGEFFIQLGMLVLESRQPFESLKGRQDGPHCPKDVGVWSGHVCGSTTPQCMKANEILKQMQTLWRNHVPLCIEVLILPNCPHGRQRSSSTDVTPPYEDDGYVLLEQWTIQAVQKKPNEVVVSPKNLFQALKSYLHFSQLSSWLSSSQGTRPTCIGYRVSPPAEFCTTTFTQDPQLHVFPVGNINKSTNFKVWLAYLSRTPEIPDPVCYEMSPTGRPCSSDLQATQNKKRMSRSKSPRPRFEAVFQNITGSPKLISKSCSSSHSRPLIPVQQFQLASILETPPLRSTYELSEDFLSDSSLSSDSKDDAYGIGFSDFKSQCDVKVGHVVNISSNKNLKKLPMLTSGIEIGMRDLKFSCTELVSGLPTKSSDWSAQSFDEEFFEGKEESLLGNYDSRKDVSMNRKSKYCEMPSTNFLRNNSNKSTSKSHPIDIVTRGGKMNYAQMLIKDQYSTDSDNSCSPDIDYLLSETLLKRAEPMNPEEMYSYLSRLCKKRNLRPKDCNDQSRERKTKSDSFGGGLMSDGEMDEVHFKDDFQVKKKLLKTDANFEYENSPVCDHDNPSKIIDVCDNFVDCTKSNYPLSFSAISDKYSEGCDKRDFSEALEILESLKDEKSIKRCRKEEKSDSEQETSNSKLLLHDEAFHTQVKRSHKTQEIEQKFKQIEKTLAANPSKFDHYLKSNQLEDPVNIQDSSCHLPPSSLALPAPHFHHHNIETTPSVKPFSAVPRRLQSKTPQDPKNPSLIFIKSSQQNLTEQIPPNSCNPDKETSVSVVSNGNGCQVAATPHIPTEVEREGFRARVHHSSSMVFNSKTKLPMQSSPVPAKRLSAGCFDYDSSLSSVQAIKNSLSCNNLDDAENSSDGCNRLRQAFSSSAPASTNCLLGNFEESLINGRIQPAGVIDGFTAEIGASGSFCPAHLTLPCLAFFFSLSEDSAPSPYLGHINLESHSKRGYRVPNKGTVQVTLFNPNKSVLKIFVVTYDVSDMPPNHQTLLRQKTVYMPTPGSPSDTPGAAVYLRYLIHLRFASSKQCKIYLHTDIRLIFARDRFELDNRIYHYELRSFTETPENPKYSPKK